MDHLAAPGLGSRPLRALIVDDEPLVRRGLRRSLGLIPGVRVIGECRNGTDALAAVRRERPDLVLLDIQMPGLTGVEVVEAVDEAVRPAIIFVTAHHEYAARAFDLWAVDYLLKPFDRARLAQAIGRARQRLADRRGPVGELGQPTPADGGATGADRILVKHFGKTVVVPVDRITWCEAADNYVRLHLPGGRLSLRETLHSLEARLDSGQFTRIHRSALVNLARVRELVACPNGDAAVRLSSDVVLRVSRRYRRRLVEKLARGSVPTPPR